MKTVLIVDDDLGFAEMAASLLEARGYRSLRARDGSEAVERLKGLKPDAILLDLGMPDMDGRELLRLLKSDPVTRPIPVMVCTISRESDLRGEVLSLGASDFMPKTAYLKELVPRIERAMGSPEA